MNSEFTVSGVGLALAWLAEENDDRCDDEGGTQNCQEGKKPQWYLLSLKMDRAEYFFSSGPEKEPKNRQTSHYPIPQA